MIELDKHHHEKGNISVVENDRTIPFEVKRIYYLYDVPGGESRGGHAHKELSQLIVAVSGSFTVIHIIYMGSQNQTNCSRREVIQCSPNPRYNIKSLIRTIQQKCFYFSNSGGRT